MKISISPDATVPLKDVTINGDNDYNYSWAGIKCLGNATIIRRGNNTVRGFYEDYSGIHISQNYTLTISGNGSLTASSNGYGAGIGGGNWLTTRHSIGAGNNGSCGTINIETGANVTQN